MKTRIVHSITITAIALLFNLNVSAQVAINTTGTGPDGSAILDLTNSDGKGFLIPAIDDVDNVNSPAQHLFIYQTGTGHSGAGLYYYEGSSWTRLASGAGSVSGVTATLPLSSTGGSAPEISISKASTTSDGYLSTIDYTRFDAAANVLWTPSTGSNAYYHPGYLNEFISIGTATASNRLYVKDDNTSGRYVAYFDNSGNSTTSNGIQIKSGTASTSNALFINLIKGDGGVAGKAVQNGAGVTWATTSDSRLKNNIKKTNVSLDNLMRIKVRDYFWNNDPSNQLSTGFIAQELYEVYPAAVVLPANTEETWMIAKEELIPLIVKSIQDQQTIIKAQEEKIKSLEERLSALEQKIGK